MFCGFAIFVRVKRGEVRVLKISSFYLFYIILIKSGWRCARSEHSRGIQNPSRYRFDLPSVGVSKDNAIKTFQNVSEKSDSDRNERGGGDSNPRVLADTRLAV